VFRTRGLRRNRLQNLSVPASKGAEQEEGAILNIRHDPEKWSSGFRTRPCRN